MGEKRFTYWDGDGNRHWVARLPLVRLPDGWRIEFCAVDPPPADRAWKPDATGGGA